MEEELNYRTLINKFLDKEISDAELDILKAWLKEDPANRRIFDEENEIWQKTGIKTNIDYFDTDRTWSELSKKLGFGENGIEKVTVIGRTRFRLLVAAASVASLIAIGGLSLWLSERRSSAQAIVYSSTVQTEEGEKAHITLTDSTQVVINSGSCLEYTTAYNVWEREVRLAGEAFFDVKTNPEKPFIVHLNNMTVSATGTRFNVFSYENENRIETTLEEGNIQVRINGLEAYDLKKGQQVVYFEKTRKALVRDVNTETYTSWKENKLRFIDTPFEEVLRKLARRYKVTFEIRDRELLELKYTATFIDESINDVMQMLKTVSPITYKIQNRTTVNDKHYLKPKIVVRKRKTS